MRVAMIGAGNVGIASGARFTAFGHEVTCVDTRPPRRHVPVGLTQA